MPLSEALYSVVVLKSLILPSIRTLIYSFTEQLLYARLGLVLEHKGNQDGHCPLLTNLWSSEG